MDGGISLISSRKKDVPDLELFCNVLELFRSDPCIGKCFGFLGVWFFVLLGFFVCLFFRFVSSFCCCWVFLIRTVKIQKYKPSLQEKLKF